LPHDRRRPKAIGGEQHDPAAQACFCRLLRLAATASRRARSAALTVTMIPLRIPETRTPASPWESSMGLNRQVGSTSAAARCSPSMFQGCFPVGLVGSVCGFHFDPPLVPLSCATLRPRRCSARQGGFSSQAHRVRRSASNSPKQCYLRVYCPGPRWNDFISAGDRGAIASTRIADVAPIATLIIASALRGRGSATI
jgi:hypothetical protein